MFSKANVVKTSKIAKLLLKLLLKISSCRFFTSKGSQLINSSVQHKIHVCAVQCACACYKRLWSKSCRTFPLKCLFSCGCCRQNWRQVMCFNINEGQLSWAIIGSIRWKKRQLTVRIHPWTHIACCYTFNPICRRGCFWPYAQDCRLHAHVFNPLKKY
jgi:hypothetical protein